MDYTITVLVIFANIIVLAVIFIQKKYTSLSMRLLIPSHIMWLLCYLAIIIHFLTRFTVKAPNNGFCIGMLIFITSCMQSANLIETEVVITIFCTFYRCYKLYPVLSSEATQKLFLKVMAITFFVIAIVNTSRILTIVLQEAVYMTPEGYCMTISDMFTVTPITQYIGGVLFIIVISAQILFSVFSGILAYRLSKNNNSTQSASSQKCLLKITVIMSCATLVSAPLYYAVVLSNTELNYFIAKSALLCERCIILYMISDKSNINEQYKCGLLCI